MNEILVQIVIFMMFVILMVFIVDVLCMILTNKDLADFINGIRKNNRSVK